MNDIDLDAVAAKYKEDTGYTNMLGSVRENLQMLWPYIKEEIEKTLDN